MTGQTVVEAVLGGALPEPPVVIIEEELPEHGEYFIDENDHHDHLNWDKLGDEPIAFQVCRSIIIGIDDDGNEFVLPADN